MKSKEEIVVETKEQSAPLEHWWSATASSHRVLYMRDNRVMTAKFSDHALIIDPKAETELSKVLHSRSISGIYLVVNKPYDEGKERNAFMDYLYRIVRPDGEVLFSGIKKVRGLFTPAELAEKKIVASDYTQLIGLAIGTKSLDGLGFKK